jgi:hypothetical protein
MFGSVFFIVCVLCLLCFVERVTLSACIIVVMCVVCLLMRVIVCCLTVLPLPSGGNLFAVK